MGMFGIAEHLRTFFRKSMQQWRLLLTANSEDLGEVNMKRGLFQGDSLSPSLLFVLSMVSLYLILFFSKPLFRQKEKLNLKTYSSTLLDIYRISEGEKLKRH